MDGHGPLTFVAQVDLAALASLGLDPDPARTTAARVLLRRVVPTTSTRSWARGTQTLAGARLLHVEAPADDCVQQPAPDGVTVLPERHLTGRQTITFPTWEHPVVEQAFERRGARHDRWMSHPVNGDDFLEALDAFREQDEPGHQLGGWAEPIQGPVEDEVARAALGGEQVDLTSPAHAAEAARWTLLLQIGSEAEQDVFWGDLGALYWMVRRDHLPQLDEVSFTWQCG